jgi:hypothetical protein
VDERHRLEHRGGSPARPAILSTVAVSGAHGAGSLAALTDGCQSAFAAAIVVAELGMIAAAMLLGGSREPRLEAIAEAEPAVA